MSEYDCLVRPVMTEKTMNSKGAGVHVFRVRSEATKSDVKRAVEKVFGVKVSAVNILNRKGKKRLFRRVSGMTESKKYAVVSLSDGAINFEGGI
jgi:large subunit ribosomal protein L23